MGPSHWRGGQVVGDKFGLKFRALFTEYLDECLYVYVGEMWRQVMVKVFHGCQFARFLKLALSNLKMNLKMGRSHWRGGQVLGDQFGLKFRAVLKEFLDKCLYVYVAEMWRQMMIKVFHGFHFARFLKVPLSNLKLNLKTGPSHWRGGQVVGDKFGLKFRAVLKEFLDECLYVYVAEMCR